ncbi:hypothetical protein [Halomonas aquatica]|uniref:Uncharacterized protein n=1 Tax=Halomonas aquatica TaxID=3151123 RepID=A0ABV1NG49_9GAMM
MNRRLRNIEDKMTITRDMLAQAPQEGTCIAHLSSGLAWTAHLLAMPPERLEKPLAPRIAALLESVERVVSSTATQTCPRRNCGLEPAPMGMQDRLSTVIDHLE